MTTPSAKAIVFCEEVFQYESGYTTLDGVAVNFNRQFDDSGTSEAISFWIWVWFVSHAGPAGKGTVTLGCRNRFRPQLKMAMSAQAEVDFTEWPERHVAFAVEDFQFPEPGTYVFEFYFDGSPAGIQEIAVFER